MPGIASNASFKLHFDKTLNDLFYNEEMKRTKYYPRLFTSKKAPPGADYTVASMTGLGLARSIPEGGRIGFDVPAEGNKISRVYGKSGLGVQFTEELLDDDIYKNWQKVPKELVDSIEEKVEYDHANVLSLGFSTSIGQDGKPLFASNHVTLKSGHTRNNLGSAALSSATLQAAFDYGQNMIGENGFLRPRQVKMVVVHPSNMWVIEEILKAQNRVWTYTDPAAGLVAANVAASGAQPLNRLNPANGFVDDWKIFVWPYLADQNDWFVLYDDYELSTMWKWQPTLEHDGDFGTGNAVYKATARYTAFCNKYETMFGNQVA